VDWIIGFTSAANPALVTPQSIIITSFFFVQELRKTANDIQEIIVDRNTFNFILTGIF